MAVFEDHWTRRVVEKGEDPWGLARWTFQILAGKKDKRVLVVDGYCVCSSTESTAGELTAWKQQFNILRERMKGKINPRRQFVIDLQSWLMVYIQQGVEVILYLDGNEDISQVIGQWCEVPGYQLGVHESAPEHKGSLATLVTTCGLVDVLKEQHSQNIPPTYIRGKKRLDYVFVSSSVMESVERSCLLPYHTFFEGDHRPILIDFNAEKLFGDPSHQVQRHKSRGLKLEDPRVVDQYLETLGKQLTYHKLYDKVERLNEVSEANEWTNDNTQQYEIIDTILTESARHADRVVAKRYSGTYEWSPALLRTVNAARYWTLRLKISKGIRVDGALLSNLREEARLPVQLSDAITKHVDIVENLREARRQMRDHQKRHVELRRTYLEELAEATVLSHRPWLADEENEQQKQEKTEKQLKELIKREDVRRMHRLLGNTLKEEQGKGLTKLDVPDETAVPPKGVHWGDPKEAKKWRGPWRSITDPEEMAKYIAKVNIRNFHQAHPTPFCGGAELGRQLGKYSDTQVADAILGGEDLPPHLTEPLMEETKRMLQTLGLPLDLAGKKVTMEITSEGYCSMYKAVKEKISSSPSEKHVGHYKAAVKRPALAKMYADLMSLPYREGFSPQRWRVVLDVMLPKEKNNWKISRLRIIQLYESDANQSMRYIFARQLGFLLEDNAVLPEMQFGSRPGKMSISPVLQKVLTYDIARQSKSVIGCIENDAISCYDRISNSLGYLLLRRLGVPLQAIRSLADTWSQMTHVIQTAHGRSGSAYRSTTKVPLYGAGQGSTNGPFFWILMFWILFASIDTTLRALLFISACCNLAVSRIGDAFVDDSHLGVTSAHEDDPAFTLEENIRLHELRVTEDLGKLAQHYERLLWSTGGALNIGKCSWNLISWRWKNGRAKLATIEQAPAALRLTAGMSLQKETVPRLQPTETYRTLGVFLNGKGCMKRPLAIQRGRSAEFAGKIGPVHMNAVTAYFAYMLYFCPKIGYALPVSTFTFRECGYIQAPALMAILPKLKINRNTARAIIHGPQKFGGIQLRHAYAEQGHGQLRLFLGHLRNRDHTGELIHVSLSFLQITVGSTRLCLNLPFKYYAKWVENSWLKSLWEFLDRTKFSLDLRRAWLPALQREGDATIMSIFIASGYGGGELAQLNRCRLFHQVFFISDIATANGQLIDSKYRRRERNNDRRSTWKWPCQGAPDSQAWRLWDQALAHMEQRGKLRVPLGRWIATSHQRWAWQFNSVTKEIVNAVEGVRRVYAPLLRSSTRRVPQLYCLDTYTVSLEEGEGNGIWAAATPVFSDVGETIFSAQSSDAFYAEPEVEEAPVALFATFQERLASSSEFFHRLLGPLPALTDATLANIGVYIEEGSLLTCSDGSTDVEQGTSCQAWVFSDKDGHVLWGGAGPIDGDPAKVTSYRSELGGITSILFLLSQVIEHLEIKSGSVTLYCDNQGALSNVFDEYPKRGIFPLLERDYDLLGAARALWRTLPCSVRHVWVKGHYKGKDREISHDLNDLADYMAEQFQRAPPPGFRPRLMPALHPEYEAALYHSGTMVTTPFRDLVYEQLFTKDLAANIRKKTGWTVQQFDRIAWEAFHAAFRGRTTFQKISCMKLTHDLWNTGAQKRLFDQDEHGLCPACNSVEETVDHVFQCQSPATVALKRQLLEELREKLGVWGTPGTITRHIIAGLSWWLEGGSGSCPRAPGFGRITGADVWATNAYSEQTDLGWGQMLRGRVSSQWGQAFVKETKSSKPKEAQRRWTSRLIKLLWDLAFQLWINRNGILHGPTVEEQQEIRQGLLHTRIEEAYQLFANDSSIVAAAAQHLFDQPMEVLLRRQRQYKLCWLRSVDVAIATQLQEVESLRRQAERFFGTSRRHQQTLEGAGDSLEEASSPTQRLTSLAADITNSECYNLRRRHLPCSEAFSEEELVDIPPAMFECSESSYSGPFQRDVGFNPDSPLHASELEWLAQPPSPSSSTSVSSQHETYACRTPSEGSCQGDSISAGELRVLFSGAPGTASSSQSGATTAILSWVGRPMSPLLSLGYNSPRAEMRLQPGPQASNVGLSPISSESSLRWRVPFPLREIGALRGPMQGTATQSTSPPPILGLAQQGARLEVFAEVRGSQEESCAVLGQSIQSDLSLENSTLALSTHTVDNMMIHRLVNRAIHWLLWNTADNRFPSISPSVYWAIRSLPVYYAMVMQEAHRAGAPPMIEMHDAEWPDAPDGEEQFGMEMLPDWLTFILTLDNVHQWGLAGISNRRGDSATKRRSMWYMPDRLDVQDIPVRELDDPPDWGEGEQDGDGLIVELSSGGYIQIE